MYTKAVFFAVAAVLIGASAGEDTDGCQALSCEACVNITGCVWLNCPKLPPACHNKTLSQNDSCSNASCAAVQTTTVVPVTTPNATHTPVTTTSNTSNTTETTATTLTSTSSSNMTTVTSPASTTGNGTSTTKVSPTPAPHKNSTFDAASFIGGIVLVLGLQAVIFFLYKFCKSKDRNYHTL